MGRQGLSCLRGMALRWQTGSSGCWMTQRSGRGWGNEAARWSSAVIQLNACSTGWKASTTAWFSRRGDGVHKEERGTSVADWSVKQRIVFWWMLFLVIQQVERWFLLPDVMNAEAPSIAVLLYTFSTGFRADLI